jgi:hypothetical protein
LLAALYGMWKKGKEYDPDKDAKKEKKRKNKFVRSIFTRPV